MKPYVHAHHLHYAPRPRPAGTGDAAICLAGMDWPGLWTHVQQNLRERGCTTSTLRAYRHVLRSFSRWFYSTPERVTARAVKTYILKLTDRHCSWSWTATNIAVLRAVFDRQAGLSVCDDLVTPKRPHHLPTILSRNEVARLLSSADTARDQLLLGLMYGCGLKVGELCALRWSDVDCGTKELRIQTGAPTRHVPFAGQLLPLLEKGCSICPPDDYIFRGNRVGDHLSTRMAEYVLQRAATAAKIDKPLCGMVMRHSYAVHRLQDGATIRDVQDVLGLRSVYSAIVYLRCALPAGLSACEHAQAGVTSPLEALVDGSGPEESLAPEVPVPELPSALPFEPVTISIGERARLFYRSLKLHVRSRFLALRNAVNTT